MSGYKYNTTIKLRQTDAAGVLFYAEIYCLIHDCYEMFLQENYQSVGSILHNREDSLPIVHSEADYMLPLKTSDQVEIFMECRSCCTSSFTLDYELYSNGKCVATASTTHVCINATSGSVKDVPAQLRIALETT